MSSVSADDERSRICTAETDRQLVSTPRPRHRSASPRDGSYDEGGPGPSCPVRGRRLTAGETADGLRRRYYSMSASIMARPSISKRTGGGEAPRKLRVSRDATQPATGSMRSLRSSSQDSEEADEFPDRSSLGGINVPVCGRPRAATCPESKAFRRRARVRSFNRPPTPTPTPGGTDKDSPSTDAPEDECSCATQRFADLRLNSGFVRESANDRVTKSPSLSNCGADLPAISESQ